MGVMAMKKAGFLFVGGMMIISAVFIAGLGGTPGNGAGAASWGASGQSLLAGRNVNMVSGTKLPFGDPWLQRQNEPSIAASTRNPLHLLAGANDYRTIDMPDDFKLPGIEGTASADAWLGVYESFNGGESWITTLLPGFPQDFSVEGLASPLNAYETACDPIVRAGANGLFYYCGIAFDRVTKASAIFVARYVDNNNLEKVEVKLDPDGTRKYSGPIQYIDTRLVATGSTSSSFIDMPNMAVDVPRGGALYGNIYVAYTVFSNTGGSSTEDKIFIQKSTDGGVTWSTPPVQLSATGDVVQRPIIAIDPIDLKGNTLYVAFRRFARGNVPDGIVVVKSTNGGKSFSKLPDVAPSFYPFDQGTSPSPSSFRTNSYPTIAVGDLGTVYVAWSQRHGGPTGQARIMISALRKGGLVWTPAQIVDQTYAGVGHQFMPSLTFAAWKLMLAWYDQREDSALDASPSIADSQGATRHTIDIRAAEGRPGLPPTFSPSIQLSRYLHVLDLDANGNPIEEDGYYRVIQAEYNHINYPLFQLGTVPFHGDYLEVTPSVRMLPPAVAFGKWIYNINPLEPTSFQTAWTDNRDVRPPSGDMWGDWVNYNAPGSIQEGWPDPVPPDCLDGFKTGLRNQNIYTANINKGLIMGSPGNTKQLDLPLTGEGGRTFVVFVKNTTEFERTLNLVILQIGGVNASFDQFRNDDNIEVTIQPHSSVSRTVFVDRSTRTLAPVTVNAFEGLRLVGYVILNPDPTNLPLSDPDNPFQDLGKETHDPDVGAPLVWNYDLGDESDPSASAILSPRVQNPRVQNYSIVNPRVQNTGVLNPRVQNESIVNNEVPNPRVQNTVVPNGALTDVTWTVTNEGNTTSVFTTNIRSEWPEYFNGEDPPLIAQVLVYKVNRVPVDKDCQLYETHQDELIVNVSNPRVQNPRVQNSPPPDPVASTQNNFGSIQAANLETEDMTSPMTPGEQANVTVQVGDEDTAMDPPISIQAADLEAQDITFYLAPGEQAEVIFRVWDEDTTDGLPTFSPAMVIAEAVAEAVNTEDVEEGSTTPPSDVPPNSEPWTTPQPQIGVSPLSLSFGTVLGLSPASQLLTVWNSGGGALNYTIAVDQSWLSVSPLSGTSASPSDGKGHDVTVASSSLPIGTYKGTITISDPKASNNPLRIPVTLTISTAPPPTRSEWVARYNGPGNGLDQLRALVVDASGNVYVTGEANLGVGNSDFVTIKYDPSGNQLWAVRYNGAGNGRDYPNAIAVDSVGNVYVTGEGWGPGGNKDYSTVKYDSAGNQLWAIQYNGSGNTDDYAYDIAVDSAGNAYVTGYCGRGSTKDDIVTIKYAGATGAELWNVHYNGAGDDNDIAYELALDSLGNVYVCGGTYWSTTNIDFVTLKYDSLGNQLWAVRYDGPISGRDMANELALDAAGNVYIAGSSEGDGTGPDYVTVKYDVDGNKLWDQRYSSAGAGSDSIQELFVSTDGSAYVTGWTQGTAPLRNITTICYNSAGGQTWLAQYSGPGNGDNIAFELALDPSGALYVTGGSTGGSGKREFVTIKYNDLSGRELWVRRYDGPGTGDDFAHEVSLDASGNIIVAGLSTGDGTDIDLVTIKYGPDLEEWHAEYNGPANGDDDPQAIASDGSGNLYVAASSENSVGNVDYLTIKYDPDGNKLWEMAYNGPGNGNDVPSAIAVDDTGNVYVTGSSSGATTGGDFATIMYDSDGTLQWTARYNRPSYSGEDSAHAIALGTDGVHVTGRSFNGTDFDWVTVKYGVTGSQVWATFYNNGGGDWPFAMAVDEEGDVYVTGESVIVSGGIPTVDTEMTTVKYSGSDGSQLAIDRYTDTLFPGFTDISQATDIAIRNIAGEMAVVVTGLSNGYEAGSNFVTIRYDAGLARQWLETYNGPGGSDDVPVGVEIDSTGNVYVTGYSPGSISTNRDFATIKYGPDGSQLWLRRFNGASSLDDAPAALALDTLENAYVVGWSTLPTGKTEYAMLKYDPQGVETWLTRFRGSLWGDHKAKAVAVDPAGNVFITGQSEFYVTGPIIHWNIMTFKYRKEGF